MGCEWTSGVEKEQCEIMSSEWGSYFDEFAQPETRTAEELFPWDFERWESAWMWGQCNIESHFNDIRRSNQQAEIHDPECNSINEEQLQEMLEGLNRDNDQSA